MDAIITSMELTTEEFENSIVNILKKKDGSLFHCFLIRDWISIEKILGNGWDNLF